MTRLDPGLYLVPTPIGNLEDITLRALRILKSVDLIACEDTRHSLTLLQAHGISTRLISFHDHSAAKKEDQLLSFIKEGKAVALISDAGTPGLCDPGFELVQRMIQGNLGVYPLPGASAPLTALVGSGLPVYPHYFHGFLPRKSQELEKLAQALMPLSCTLVFFESPHRLAETLMTLHPFFPHRQGVVARELTKMHETFHRGTLQDLGALFETTSPRGECVLMIQGRQETEVSQDDLETLLRDLLQNDSLSQAVKEAHQITQLSKKMIYERALVLDKKRQDF